MKILHITDTLALGGAESLIVALSCQQIADGNDVTIVVLVKPSDPHNIEVARNSGVKVDILSDRGNVYNPMQIFKLLPYLRDCDIVHVHLTPAIHWAGFAWLLSRQRPTMIVTIHSTNGHKKLDKFMRPVDMFLYRHCYSAVISCSEKAGDTFRDRFNGIKVDVISNGVELAKFIEAKPYGKNELCGIDDSVFLVTMVARFAWMKRQDVVVHALSKLPPCFHLAFVGGGDDGMKKVVDLSESLNVRNRVHFIGQRSDVERILKTSDVNLLASDFEGLSISSIEGMASGRPFVASDVNGLRESVENAGLLFDNSNVQSLVDILLKLYYDRCYYQSIGERCFQRAKQYDIRGCAQKYEEVYQREILRK